MSLDILAEGPENEISFQHQVMREIQTLVREDLLIIQ